MEKRGGKVDPAQTRASAAGVSADIGDLARDLQRLEGFAIQEGIVGQKANERGNAEGGQRVAVGKGARADVVYGLGATSVAWANSILASSASSWASSVLTKPRTFSNLSSTATLPRIPAIYSV